MGQMPVMDDDNPHDATLDADELHDATMFERYLRALCEASNLRYVTLEFILENFRDEYYRKAQQQSLPRCER